ncbi:MAG: FG-GAP-like repeat-containing protein, partial [Methanosarcinales archaeon]
MNNGTYTYCSYCHTNGGKEFNDTFIKSSNTNITHNGTKQCYECHGFGRFHNESIVGGGGPACLDCHDLSGNLDHLVNGSAIELGMHSKVNNGSSNSTGVSAENKKCWGCHTSDGNEPENESMGDKYNNPWTCIDCHTQEGSRNSSTWTNNSALPPEVYEHQPNAVNIKTNVSGNGTCQNCHNNSIVYNNDTKGGNLASKVSHYGTTKDLIDTSTCDTQNCHKNVQWGDLYGNAPQTLMGSQGVNCTYCHTLNKTVPASNLHNDSIGTYWRCYDAGCHNLGGRRRIGINLLEKPLLVKNMQISGFPVKTDAKIDATPTLYDINQDGNIEIIISNEKKVYVFDVNGTLIKGWPRTGSGASLYSSPAVGDIDGDKEVEIVIGGGYMNSHVQVWKIDGTLVLDTKLDDDVYSTPTLFDLDGDGDLEIIIGSMSGNVYALQGNGSLILELKTGGKVGSKPAVGDLDKDGNPEIVVTSMDGKVYAWNSDGSSVNGFPVNAESLWLSSPAIADLDKDGKDEIIVASKAGKLYAFNGDGSLVEGWPINTDQIWHSTPAIGDIDSDGNLEIVVGSDFGKVYALHNNGSLVYGFPQYIQDGVVSSPVLTDLNGDKKMEMVIGGMDGKVYAFHSNGSLVSGFPKETSKAWLKGSPAVADLDKD